MKNSPNNSLITSQNNLITVQLLTVEDSEKVYQLIAESRSELKNLIWSQNATLESTIVFIKNKKQSQDQIFGVFNNDTLIGVLELRKKEEFTELGYWLGTKYSGQGLMKLAVKNLVDKQFNLNTVIAHIRANNKASYQILKYAGLAYDHSELWQGEEWLHFKKNNFLNVLKKSV